MDKQAVRKDLEGILSPKRVLTAPEELISYQNDAFPYRVAPDLVAIVENVDEIVKVVKYAEKNEIPIIPRAAATGLSGGTCPQKGGIVMDVMRLDKIIEIDQRNLTATVECGVINKDFQDELAKMGLFYPPDPSSWTVSTIGGNVATRAGGPKGVKYGTTEDYVLGVEAVIGGGEILKAGGKTVKFSSGYDLPHLFAGSEGTLGIMTKVTVRLIPLPETKKTMMVIFDTLDEAAQTVSEIIGRGIIPVCLELMDKISAQCVESWKPVGLPTDADGILLIEVDGDEYEVEKNAKAIEEVCRSMKPREFKLARSAEEAEQLWLGRRSVFSAMAQQYTTVLVEDITVPRTKIPDIIRACREAGRKHDVIVSVLGHAGDGNIHPQVLTDIRDKEELARVDAALADIAKAGLELGGTLSGEHGIGVAKSRFFVWEHGEVGKKVMMGIKAALDPKNIFNPGKLFEEGGQLA